MPHMKLITQRFGRLMKFDLTKGKRIWNHLDAGHIAFTTREFSAQSQTLQEDAGSIVGAVDGIGSNSGSVIPEIHSFGIQF